MRKKRWGRGGRWMTRSRHTRTSNDWFHREKVREKEEKGFLRSVRIGLEVAKEGKRSKNEKRRKAAIVIELEQTWTLWKEEFNTYNSHDEHFVQF
ncbi:hypothetical protein PIB30_082950 [Stylosanthes scabra]|uniref:Uncharacterized protein n=1 Tax=Stylosanthes scabra TaxID=79078 RepID=A0ABU6UQY0_9FABA|nr:hypothetical protein [Stylosanthes scabra]